MSDFTGPAMPAERAGVPPESGLVLRLASQTGIWESDTAPIPDTEAAAAGREELTLSLGESVRLGPPGRRGVGAGGLAGGGGRPASVAQGALRHRQGVGKTSVTVVGSAGLVQDRDVTVGLDLAPLRSMLASDPALQGLEARRMARGVALNGEVASAALAQRALQLATASLPENTFLDNGIRVGGAQQVNLEVQIAEVQRSIAEDLGINWEVFGTADNDALGFRVGRLFTNLFPADLNAGSFSADTCGRRDFPVSVLRAAVLERPGSSA